MNKIRAFVFLVIAVSFGIAFRFFPNMPDMMASHWDYRGEVDGYMPKFWALFLMPLLSLVLFLLFLVLPRIDPRHASYRKFQTYYDGFILVFELFLFYMYLLTIFWSVGGRFNMTEYMLPGMGILFIYLGFLLEQAKPNWFIGIRTPWTLSSEAVWTKTHRLGGKLYKEAGVIALLGVFAGQWAIFFVLVPIIAVSLYLTFYSYLEYRGQERHRR